MTTIDCPKWERSWDDSISASTLTCQVGNAYKEAIANAKSKIIELDDIKRWHRIMFEGLVPLDEYAGDFRQDDSTRPCLGKNVGVGSIPGEEFHRVIYSMESLIVQIRESIALLEVGWSTKDNRDKAFGLAVIIGDLIGNFIRIHPFINGNGRTSRIIWAAALVRFGVKPQFRIHPRPDSPYGSVMKAAMAGDNKPLQMMVLQHLAQPQHPPILAA
jgi:fido (protein-threonine AMPylation protein)